MENAPRAGLPEEELRGLAHPLRDAAADLLLYKSLFRGAWFEHLASHQADARVAETLRRMSRETEEETRQAIQSLQAWSPLPSSVEEILPKLRADLIEDLLTLKESTTEAFLLVGMRAPTSELRRTFVALADIDRRHADALRALLGTHRVEHRLGASSRPQRGAAVGAHNQRAPHASLAQSVQRAIDDLRADGQEPARITLSAVALRHARDEGMLGPDDGTALGLQVDVDFGWRGECFAVRTRDHATLSEIITASRTAKARD
jgi:hypothetical protein